MKCQILSRDRPGLSWTERPVPEPGPGQILVEVRACGVCRTDLHEVDQELRLPVESVVPGHEIVGVVARRGPGVDRFREGDRVGVPWLGWTCGACDHCLGGRENLCERARFTGFHMDGGYAPFALAHADFALPLPGDLPEAIMAPLLCAGLIGYRCLKMTGDAHRIGLYGFGAAAHILIQVARFQGREVHAFTRPGDRSGQDFALRMGALRAGDSDAPPERELDAAVIFAPVGALVPRALEAVRPGGVVVLGGIHMSDIPSFPYRLIWGERSLKSVANLTRKDGIEFLELAPRVPVTTHVCTYPLRDASRALDDLRHGAFEGAAVLLPGPDPS